MLLHDNFNVKDLKALKLTQLPDLAQEVRNRIIDVVSKNGGHIAPSLGVVELTIALHYIYNSPRDKIIWDVGHQSYAHKILTGRNGQFDTLRQYNGISGFPKLKESPHDVFEVGHSSTSLSAAIGFAAARDIKGENHKVVAVIGDGSMTNGMPFEALNNIGHSDKDVLIVLNDNKMSISKNVGAFSKYLNKIFSSEIYNRVRGEVWKSMGILKSMSKQARNIGKKIEESVKNILTSGVIFEELGIRYFGPIDGHNLADLLETLNNLNKIPGPKLLHIITKKGKGYEFAENNACKFHGIAPFKIETGETAPKKLPTYTSTFADTLVDMAKKDKNICAITAAMPSGTGLNEFQDKFPRRFFDVGIAEGHAVTFATALALQGLKPYVTIYSTFLQRAFDQMIHDTALQKAPVKFMLDRGGLVGDDGATHQGVFDYSYLNLIPNFRILLPKDQDDLVEMMKIANEYTDGPISIRYPRGCIFDDKYMVFRDKKLEAIQHLCVGEKNLILTAGRITYNSYGSILELNANIGLVAVTQLKPFDEKRFLEILQENNYKNILVIEENTVIGGLGNIISEIIASHSLDVKYRHYGIPDHFIPEGDVYGDWFPELKLDSTGIAEVSREFFEL